MGHYFESLGMTKGGGLRYIWYIWYIWYINGRVAVCGTRIVAGDVRGAVMKWQIGEGEEVSCNHQNSRMGCRKRPF